MYASVQKWLSDPIVIMLLAFIGTSIALKAVKRFIDSRKK